MTKQFLMVRDIDNLVHGVQIQDDPDDGPIIPQGACVIDGATLVQYEGEFTRVGRKETEQAYLRGDVVEWVETATLDDLRAAAITEIDAAGEALRLAVVNHMPMQTEEYRRVESLARAWALTGYPEDKVPRSVSAWSNAKHRSAWTARQAADDILATADTWNDILDTIRELRLAKKEDVRHAAGDEIAPIVASVQEAMRTMAKQLNLTLPE